MDWTALFGVDFPVFLLVLSRTSGLLIAAPYFQSRSLPAMIKVGLTLFLSLVLAPVLSLQPGGDWVHGTLWLQSIAAEVVTGLTMGFVLNLSFAAIQLAGQMIDISIGFGVVNIIDPQSGSEMPIMGQLQQLLAMWLFLVLNGDHLIIKALVYSYKLIPPGGFTCTTPGVRSIVHAFSGMFLLGVQIALPIVGAIFLADLTMGIVSRLIPQINVFMTGFPIKIVLGLLLVILATPFFSHLIGGLVSSDGGLWQAIGKILPLFRR